MAAVSWSKHQHASFSGIYNSRMQGPLSALILSALIWALDAIAPIIRVARIKADHFRPTELKIRDAFVVQRYFDLS